MIREDRRANTSSDRLAAGRATDAGQVVSELPGTVVLHAAGSGVGLATPSYSLHGAESFLRS